jgi:hypothetical protein
LASQGEFAALLLRYPPRANRRETLRYPAPPGLNRLLSATFDECSTRIKDFRSQAFRRDADVLMSSLFVIEKLKRCDFLRTFKRKTNLGDAGATLPWGHRSGEY